MNESNQKIVRYPAVAGQFYPATPTQLAAALDQYLQTSVQKTKAIGIVVPHAGYIYSGAVAGKVYATIHIPNKALVLCPNHTGLGAKAALMDSGSWQLPNGNISIDETMAMALMKECSFLTKDHLAHLREHSLEVQLPFLLRLNPQIQFVPITLSHLKLSECEMLGEAIARVTQNLSEPLLIVASSDMNHYEAHELTLQKDQLAIDAVLEKDPAKLYETVHTNHISMCGIIPTTVMLYAANRLGAKKATLIDHQTSGPVSGDYESVVGYAGIVIE